MKVHHLITHAHGIHIEDVLLLHLGFDMQDVLQVPQESYEIAGRMTGSTIRTDYR